LVWLALYWQGIYILNPFHLFDCCCFHIINYRTILNFSNLTPSDPDPFFVLNSDVICEFPLAYLRDFHIAHGKEGTLMTTPVDDPSKYGVVFFEKSSSLVNSFIEKPVEFVGNQINAGFCFILTICMDSLRI
jgi:mannose-1-phosphate guanylyltransferase